MKGFRQAIWNHALTVRAIRAREIAEQFGESVSLVSANLREMAEIGCFTRTWKVEKFARYYEYKAVPTCPPPGKGNYLHMPRLATVRLKTARSFRYTKIEHMPVVQL